MNPACEVTKKVAAEVAASLPAGGATVDLLHERVNVGRHLIRRCLTALLYSGEVREVQRYTGERGAPRRFYVPAKAG